MEKCLLISFFKSDNLGDLVLADNLYNFVSGTLDVEKMSYATGTPFEYSNKNDMNFTRKITKKARIKTFLYNIMVMSHLEKFWESYKGKNKSETDIEIEERIKASDLVIIGGGNMIFDVSPFSRSAKSFGKIIDIAKKYHKKIFVISIGIGPFVTKIQEEQAAKELNRCDYITFRDEKSLGIYKNYYKDNKSFLTIDPAFLLDSFRNEMIKKDRSGYEIGVNLFNNKTANESRAKYEKVKKGYIKFLKYLMEKNNCTIRLFSTDLNDYPLINEISEEVSSSKLIVQEIRGFKDLMDLYNGIDLLVGCRMHSLILAYTQLIPVIGLSWQPKVNALFDIIEQTDSVFDYENIEIELENLMICLETKINNIEIEKNKIQKRLDELRKRFSINQELIERLVNN